MPAATSDTTPWLSPEDFDAIVLDLDGVITRTAKLHATAWKAMFDDFLADQAPEGESPAPFDIQRDYRRYVDGKPRYDGVQSFLTARGIDLPRGSPEDAPGQRTVCGLGNRKNRLFLERLHTDGVEVYASSIALVRALREADLSTAIVSSSRNCKAVLEAAGITDLFDARVDGTDLQRLELPGKPAPDMFREARERLGSDASRTIGVEDALAGVEAAHNAGYGCVIGVARGDQADALRDRGADLVVQDLAEVRLRNVEVQPSASLPCALRHVDEILEGTDRLPALFLDYDGTLTPIVAHPDDAVLSDSMRATLQRLVKHCDLAIISGRDLQDVRRRIGIDGIWYAGSHGFDLAGPEGEQVEYEEGADYLPLLDRAERQLREALDDVPGCLVERKRFSIATHYRQVEKARVETVRDAVEQARSAFPGLRLSGGKKIFELQPDIDWNKGKALRWLMRMLELDPDDFIPVYLGDDVTDEDAFAALQEDGIGIFVSREATTTRAHYRLEDTDEVHRFLQRMAEGLEGAAP
jgi:alpha,alpha-trehalase